MSGTLNGCSGSVPCQGFEHDRRYDLPCRLPAGHDGPHAFERPVEAPASRAERNAAARRKRRAEARARKVKP